MFTTSLSKSIMSGILIADSWAASSVCALFLAPGTH